MKRLFGTIGIIYLATLTAVFYFKSVILICLLLLAALFLAALGVYKRVKHNRYAFRTYVVSGVTIALAVLSIFLYQNYYIDPIVDNYSDKEITVEGHVCEEIKYNEKSAEYLIETTSIDLKPVSTKIRYIGYSENEVREFDKVVIRANAVAENYDREISHRVMLRAYEISPDSIKATGETVFTPYKLAVTLRKDIRKALGRMMPNSSAELSRAILLGDKYALDDEVKSDFARTGTSYLIVVSGLHLSIAITLVMSIIKRFTRRRIVLSIGAIVAVICFCALTGFNYSVIRAAIAVIIYQVGRIMLRNSDPLNSLGFAALAITITNPCAVGDFGLLMSFSSTLGIILWSEKIFNFIFVHTRIKKIQKKTLFQKRIKSILCFIVDIISVSISASLWIVPITIIAFGKISPMVVIVALCTEPFASAILVLSLFCAILYLLPVAPILTQIIAFADDMLCRLMIIINHFFAKLPVASVKADNAAVYIWLGITALLVIIGYLIKAKRNYVINAVNTSFALMLILSAVSMLSEDKSPSLTVYQTGGGLCLEMKKENNISLLSAGGSDKTFNSICSDINDSGGKADNIIVLSENYYSSLLYDISEDCRVSNLITNSDSAGEIEQFSSKTPYVLPDESIQTIRLNTETKDTLINTGGVIYQYIECEGLSVLFVPRGSDISDLPEEYRTAGYVILDGIPRDLDLLSFDKLIYTGYENKESREKIKELKNITVLKNSKYTIR